MTTQEIISMIGLLGIGAILRGIIDSFLKKRETTHKAEHEHRAIRYKAALVLMYALLDFEKEKSRLQIHRPEIKNKEQLHDEIKLEFNTMILFGSDNVLKSVKAFIHNPSEQHFHIVALAMRQDLYRIGTKLKAEDLKL